ncbi:MAG TPA: DNA metabolism protein [Clostridiaceae bacterium]|nr:DNA metabolism protein [Clostridiaceae bacterium]
MIYVTDGTFEGILTAVFEAYRNKEEPEGIMTGDWFQTSLDFNVRTIGTCQEKADRVYKAIIEKMSQEVLETIYKAWLSEYHDIGTAIYRYVRIGLKLGRNVISFIQNPDVRLINDLSMKVSKEAHLFTGILRFNKLKNGIYYARMEPDNNIVMLIADHFAERLSDQPWIIHDAKRNFSALFDTRQVVYTTDDIMIPADYKNDSEFEILWKKYFKAISIESRKNPRLQRSFMPVRYWRNLTEMQR